MEKDYFSILNLKQPSSEEDIKQAYRILAKKYHPDINHSPDAHEKFLEISEAYEFLLDQSKLTVGKTVNYNEDELLTREYFEEMRRKARERAQEKARIRAEKIQKEHEAFQESGLYDLVLLASYIARYALLVLCIFLVIWPVVMSLGFTETPYVVRLIILLFGSLGLYLILASGKKYFSAGKFYYNFKQIKKVLTFDNSETREFCYFSPQYKANSYPYKVSLFKIKDIKLHNYGPGQHGVSFDQRNVTLSIPRSRHAFIVHFILVVTKLMILFGCVFFLDISSFLWRIIIAIVLTLIISKIISVATGTKPTASFLLTTGLILRVCIWVTFIVLFSFIQLKPFDIFTSENIHGAAVFILLFDSFLDQFLNFISRRKFRIPLLKQHSLIKSYLENKYQFGYDMPVLSVFYPVYKWFLG